MFHYYQHKLTVFVSKGCFFETQFVNLHITTIFHVILTAYEVSHLRFNQVCGSQKWKKLQDGEVL